CISSSLRVAPMTSQRDGTAKALDTYLPSTYVLDTYVLGSELIGRYARSSTRVREVGICNPRISRRSRPKAKRPWCRLDSGRSQRYSRPVESATSDVYSSRIGNCRTHLSEGV